MSIPAQIDDCATPAARACAIHRMFEDAALDVRAARSFGPKNHSKLPKSRAFNQFPIAVTALLKAVCVEWIPFPGRNEDSLDQHTSTVTALLKAVCVGSIPLPSRKKGSLDQHTRYF